MDHILGLSEGVWKKITKNKSVLLSDIETQFEIKNTPCHLKN